MARTAADVGRGGVSATSLVLMDAIQIVVKDVNSLVGVARKVDADARRLCNSDVVLPWRPSLLLLVAVVASLGGPVATLLQVGGAPEAAGGVAHVEPHEVVVDVLTAASPTTRAPVLQGVPKASIVTPSSAT